MAFLRYARANIVKPQLTSGAWDKIRVASGSKKLDRNLKAQAEAILQEPFTPERFLLTHSTIVCSVDAEKVEGTLTGKVEFEGESINRRYEDFRVSSATDIYINNNLDCWSREVLARSYQTFIGAHNFVEHVQVSELSKGRIIDAVLRDVGDSLYVDILVATDRKHEQLVSDISSGKMNSMSMGCSVDFTICTKCGNVAADETEMCKHVKYEKGNVFFDEKGHKHRVAELCGHKTEPGTCGVTFIEASWVAVPAFKGAVARNTLEIPEVPGKEVTKKDELNEIPAKWVEKEEAPHAPHNLFNNSSVSVYLDLMQKMSPSALKDLAQKRVASTKVAGPFDFGDDDAGDEDKKKEEGGDKKDDSKKGLLDDIEDHVISIIKDRVKKKIEEEIAGKANQETAKEIAKEIPAEPKKEETDKATDHLNDNIIKEGSRRGLTATQQKRASLYFKALKVAVEVGKTEKDKINNIKLVNSQFNIYIPSHIYRIASAVGRASSYNDLHTFMNVVDVYAQGHPLSNSDKKNLIRLAKLLSIQKK